MHAVPFAVKESACCALPCAHRPKIQPVITAFLAGEFRRQPALSNIAAMGMFLKVLKNLHKKISHIYSYLPLIPETKLSGLFDNIH